jgi:hypothetical protein
MQRHTLVYSAQCPNCLRFIEALRMTSAASSTVMIEVSQLDPARLSRVAAVPALIQPDGTPLYGTAAFEWLKLFQGELTPDGFAGEGGALAFSTLDSAGYAMYTTDYTPFEPV